MTEEAAIIERAFSRTAKRKARKQVNAIKAQEPKPEPKAPETPFRATVAVNDDTVVRREGGYDQQLSRLEYLLSKGVITPRQADAGAWLASKWEAYFTPGVSSGIEDHAPGSIPSDPLLRWTRGQRTTDYRGKPRTPPPTFRPRRPSETRHGHDGWSGNRCEALQGWVRAQRLLAMLDSYEREVVVMVAIEGLGLVEAHMRLTGAVGRPGAKQLANVKRALHRGLDAVADDTEPTIREVAA